MYGTRRSWSRRRRVIGKAEFKDAANPRFVVTSLTRAECKPKYLYEKLYCARGDMEYVRGEFEHILWNFLIGHVVEIVGFAPYLVRISQSDAEQSPAACLKRNDVLTRGEHDLADRHHALLADGFPNNSECLLPDLSVRGDVIGIVQVDFIDLVLGHELVDVYRALAFDRDGFEFLGIKFDIVALADFVALDDICGIDLVAAFRIDLTVLDAIASFLIELMEADLLALRRGRKQSNRT